MRSASGVVQQTKGINRVLGRHVTCNSCFFPHPPPFCSHLFNPHDLLQNDESREVVISYNTEKQDGGSPGARKASVTQSSPTVSFLATRNFRQEHLPSGSSSSGVFIRFTRQGPKARSDCRITCQILSVHSGDGRSVDHPQSNVVESLRGPEFTGAEDNDADAVEVEEGRFSCMYWSSQQAVRDAELGVLVVTSDHISFEISDRNIMRCFIYEVTRPARSPRPRAAPPALAPACPTRVPDQEARAQRLD